MGGNPPAHRLPANVGSLNPEMVEEPPHILRRDLQAVLLPPWRTLGWPMAARIPQNQAVVSRQRRDWPGPHAGVAAQSRRSHERDPVTVALIAEMDAVDEGLWHGGTPPDRLRYVFTWRTDEAHVARRHVPLARGLTSMRYAVGAIQPACTPRAHRTTRLVSSRCA
jgi:hypothetical protein